MKGHHYEQPRLTNYRRIWRRRINQNWPYGLWVAVLIFITISYSRNQQFGQMAGSVDVVEEQVVPLEPARLVSVNVSIGQRVNPGDILAQMDTSMIDTLLAVEDSTVRDAQATFTADQRGIVAAMNRAETALQSAETSLKTEQMHLQSDTAELSELRREQKRREDLLTKRMIDEMQASELRPQIASLEQALAAYPKIIDTYQEVRNSAEKQLTSLQSWIHQGNGNDLSTVVSNRALLGTAILEATRETYLHRKKNYTLRANRAGLVARIMISPGNYVDAGTPIIIIVDDKPKNVTGFLPEFRPVNLRVGQNVLVWRQNEPSFWMPSEERAAILAVVTSITPNVEAFPVRINPLQVQVQGGEPIRGRRVLFKLQSPHDFSPGETVEICEQHAGWMGILDRLMLLLGGHTMPSPQTKETAR